MPRVRRTKFLFAFVALVLCSTNVSAQPALWQIDNKESAIRFIGTQAGATFEGKFGEFDAKVRFDPGDLANSSARVVIEVASIGTENSDRDEQLHSDAFFAPSRWPRATFEAESFRVEGAMFVAEGQLRIRDHRKPVSFRFTYARGANGEIQLNGEADLLRLDFGLGQGEWQDTQWVANEVKVIVKLKALTP